MLRRLSTWAMQYHWLPLLVLVVFTRLDNC